MSALQPNLLATAKQGNPKAIAALMNRSLNPKGVTVKAFMQKQRLNIFLESAEVPPQSALMEFTRKGIESLALATVQTVRVHGRQEGSDLPSWVEEFEIDTYQAQATEDLVLAKDTIVVAATTAPLHSGKGLGRSVPQPTKLAVVTPSLSPWVALGAGVGALVLALGGLGGSIAWLRHSQIQALNQAAGLTQSVGQGDPPGDIATLKTDQGQLQQAIAILDQAPTFPLVNVAALATEQDTLQGQLTQVNTDIAAYEALLPKLQAVVDQFSALDSGLDVGMNYRDYGGEIRQLKAAIDRLGREPNIEANGVYTDLQAAYDHYEFAHSVWNYYIESDERYNFFPAASSYGRVLVSTYNVETMDIVGQPRIYLNDALSAVWQAASAKVESAQERL
jgi:hypothetical protein